MTTRNSMIEYLHMLASVGDSTAPYVARCGEWFEWTEECPEALWGEAKNCYGNCAGVVLFDEEEEWDYYEGYATSPGIGLVAPHAWLVNRKTGVVADPTWRHLGHQCGFCMGTGVIVEEGDDEYEEIEGTCRWCDGKGELEEEHADRTGTVYLGIRVERDELRRILLAKGFYGALPEAIAQDLC